MTRRRTNDAGFSLVELVIACALLPLILGVVGSLTMSATKVDSTVRSDTIATSTGQVAVDSIVQSTRQADWVRVTNSAAGQLLAVRTASASATLTWSCRSWWFSHGNLYQRSAATTIVTPTISAPQGWTLLASGVAQNGSSPVFLSNAAGVAITFTISASSSPLLVTTSVVPRQTAVAGSAQCQ